MSERGSSEIGQPSGLLFVYNADGGVVERTLDYLHKLTSPATYSCSLCALTYGTLGMRAPWREFVERQPYRIDFLHRDEFIREHRELAHLPLPAVLATVPGSLPRVVVSSGHLDAVPTLEVLQGLIEEVARRELRWRNGHSTLSEPQPRA